MKYFDLTLQEKIEAEHTFYRAVQTACKRVGITLNDGYNPDKGIDLPTLDPANEFSFVEYLEKKKVVVENRHKYDDDVISYMIMMYMSFIRPEQQRMMNEHYGHTEIDVFHKAENAKGRNSKIMVYADNANIRFIILSLGRMGNEQELGEKSKTYYRHASSLSEHFYGRNNVFAAIFEKMDLMFPRYLKLSSEVFQEAFYAVRPQTNEIGIEKNWTIDGLLGQLSKAKSDEEKRTILEKLKKVTAAIE
jgi:hypothetical protein